MRIAFLILLTGLSGPLLALAASPAPEDAGLRLVVHAPWTDATALAAETRVRMVGPVSAPFGFLALSEGPSQDHQLRKYGAWAVLDGRRLAQFCGVNP